jgi:hypothetical protein
MRYGQNGRLGRHNAVGSETRIGIERNLVFVRTREVVVVDFDKHLVENSRLTTVCERKCTN